MSRVTSTTWGAAAASAAFALAATYGQVRLEPPKDPTTFASGKYGFCADLLPRWYTNIDLETPYYFNFPPAKQMAQTYLPKGGAVINIIPYDRGRGHKREESQSDWMKFEMQGASSPVSPVSVPAESEITDAVEVSYNRPDFPQKQRICSIYFRFRGKLFDADLSYLVGDPKAADYERLLLKTVRSIRPCVAGGVK
jgi:hypothetical protein